MSYIKHISGFDSDLGETEFDWVVWRPNREPKEHSMAQEIHVMNVRLPRDVIDWIDSLVKRGVYNSRSEAIRSFVREYITDSNAAGQRGGG